MLMMLHKMRLYFMKEDIVREKQQSFLILKKS